MKKSIAIADTSELILRGLKSVFKKNTDIDTFTTASFEDLKKYLKKNQKSVLLVDYTTDVFSLDKIIELKSKFKKLKIIALTHHVNSHTIIDAVKAGIYSYAQKDCAVKEIVKTVQLSIKGQQFFCSCIVDQLKKEKIDVYKIDFQSLKYEPSNLSDREIQIIQYIAEGYTNAQIAAILYISNHTVNTHRKNIMKKLGINNTVGIVMYAIKQEIVSPNQFAFNAK